MHGERRDESLQIVKSLSRGYEESMDAELQELFNFAIKKGVTLFDTADSYGESFAQVFCSSTWPVDVLHRLTIILLASMKLADINMYMTEQIWASKYQAYRIASAGTGRLNGRSEQLLGKFIAESPAGRKTRDGILVATKLAAYPWRLTPAQFVQACRWVPVLAMLRCEPCPAYRSSPHELPQF